MSARFRGLLGVFAALFGASPVGSERGTPSRGGNPQQEQANVALRPSQLKRGDYRKRDGKLVWHNPAGAKAERKLTRRAWRKRKRGAGSIARKPTSKKRIDRREIMALYCADTGKPNSGRQWVRLRKAMAREERALAAAKAGAP